MIQSIAYVLTAILLLFPAATSAQDHAWRADVSVGWAGFVDDSTRNYLVVGGSVRRRVTPRVSIGPELVVMSNGAHVTDRVVLLTGNVVVDVVEAANDRRVVPFVVVGGGIVRMRDQVRNGPFGSGDPALTAGGGIRARISEAVAAGAEYRIGWEPHQRFTAFVSSSW
ncbi:MAG: outer membrane beta-barrel protein [Planctomycetota bacterium]|nr:outer membrane beta-barrel protein [Planctomycetota bacterium]